MGQGNGAIYCRLSQDDGSAGESGSMQTQKTLLTQYCKEHSIHVADYYCDDGWSGTNFDRPEFQRMLEDIEAGKINTVVVKDLASRKKIPDVMMLESVARFVFDSIGSPISTKKIADTMTSSGRKIDVRTAEKYMDALLESFILYQARRYNIRGKQYLKTLEKYYVVDIGLRYMLLGSRSTDVGHILENVIYLELLRRGFEVSVGKMDDLEVDFVAVDQKQTVYYQVAATVRDEGTLKRELASLQKINDNYPKFILTLDEDPDADYEGIRRINALEWLMGRE